MAGERWLDYCGNIAGSHSPLLLALVLAGLSGSFTHCLSMCSVFVLGQVSGPAKKGWLARLLLPYHLGRITTYMVLGVLVGFSFHFLTGSLVFSVLRRLMLALVAMIFLTTLAGRLLARFGLRLPFTFVPKPVCAITEMTRLGQSRSPLQRYVLGLSLGLLPCGLVMAALLAVATTGSPLIGGLGMALFGLATTPGLLGLGLISHTLLRVSPRLQDALSLIALGVNGFILLALAAS